MVPAVAAFVGLANLRFYGFLVRAGGLGFALGAFPIHLLYYIVNGVCAAGGYVAHHLIGEPAPEAAVQAYAEVGVRRWPPIPARAPIGAWAPR